MAKNVSAFEKQVANDQLILWNGVGEFGFVLACIPPVMRFDRRAVYWTAVRGD
jgi:hypothetical protein